MTHGNIVPVKIKDKSILAVNTATLCDKFTTPAAVNHISMFKKYVSMFK